MKKKKNNKTKKKNIDKNLYLVINFSISLLFICLIFIEGENIWLFLRKLFLGLLGINSIFVPGFLISISILKIKNDNIDKFKYVLSCLFLFLFSSLVGIFSFPSDNFLEYFYNSGISNAGVIAGLIDILFVRCFGIVASRAILVIVFSIVSILLFKIDFSILLEKLLSFFVYLNENIKNISFNVNIFSKIGKKSEEIKEVVNSKSLGKLKKDIELDKQIDNTNYDENDYSDNNEISKVTEAFVKKELMKNDKEISIISEIRHNDCSNYKFPSIELLNLPHKPDQGDITSELNTNGNLLIETLLSFNVKAKIVDISRGPAITRYEIQPASGVKVSKITTLSDDIALNLAALGVRIEAPIPGKSAVGVEVPNKVVSTVSVREIIDSNEFVNSKSPLTVALGKDISGKCVVTDLAKMPHLLIAGSTGAGKSVCVNSFIVSLLYKSSPDEVKLLMIDPKVVELGVYNGIPHLLVPVVTDPRKSAGALNWAVNEMLGRYKIFAEIGVRDITSYNLFVEKNENAIDKNGDPRNKMAHIVIIIDELSDLMMAAPHEIEDYVCRLTQMARAAGMHLVIATQRPSVDVITGVIKANVPSRIALAVSSQIDSRTILDMGGAEKLLGRGDMLFSPVGSIKPIRVQGCYVTDEEIEKVVNFVKNGVEIEYDESIISGIEKGAMQGLDALDIPKTDSDDKDPMLEQAIKCVVELGQASTSLLQRRLRVGYARAGRLIDEMEQMGIIGPHEGSKPRAVLMSYQESLERLTR